MTSGHHVITNNPHQQQHFGNNNSNNMANLTVVNDPRQLHENIRHAKEASIQVSVRPLHRTILEFFADQKFFISIIFLFYITQRTSKPDKFPVVVFLFYMERNPFSENYIFHFSRIFSCSTTLFCYFSKLFDYCENK